MSSPSIAAEMPKTIILGSAVVHNRADNPAGATQQPLSINKLVGRLSKDCTEAESRPYIGKDPNVDAALSDKTVYKKDGKEIGYSIHVVRKDGTRTDLVYTKQDNTFFYDKNANGQVVIQPGTMLAKHHKLTPENNHLSRALCGRNK